MLPQSKIYLKDAGYSPRAASFLLIGLFLTGVIGIQFVSRVIHRLLPSHVVDCDHTHEDEESVAKQREEMAEQSHDDEYGSVLPISKSYSAPPVEENEDTPLLARSSTFRSQRPDHEENGDGEGGRKQSFFHTAPSSRKHSILPNTLTRTFSKYVVGQKENCDEEGPCMGFTDPCGQDCFKVVQHRRGSVLPGQGPFVRHQTWRSVTNDGRLALNLPGVDEFSAEDEPGLVRSQTHSGSKSIRPGFGRPRSATHYTHHVHHPDHEHSEPSGSIRGKSFSHTAGHPEHHHHVPTNAFMSIGLQTSLAIALHKAPEGFITYATNHANPRLGFAVFMALFIHNITEGFAMSLPLYLALNSRWKAIAWSSFFGGISQPLGAGVAALWFKLANRSSFGGPTEGVYGGMFAVTSGIMTSVALSLFSESLQLSHNKGTCIAFAFLGMGILGFSSALTAS